MGWRGSEGRLTEGHTRKPARWGLPRFVRAGGPWKVANPGEAESVQVGAKPKFEGAREATDRRGICFHAGAKAKAPCVRSLLSEAFRFSLVMGASTGTSADRKVWND